MLGWRDIRKPMPVARPFFSLDGDLGPGIRQSYGSSNYSYVGRHHLR